MPNETQPRGPRPVRQSAEPVTQERFNRLPATLTATEFMELTGLSEKDLRELRVTANQLRENELANVRRAGLLPVYRQHGLDGYARYYKQDAAKFGGWKL